MNEDSTYTWLIVLFGVGVVVWLMVRNGVIGPDGVKPTEGLSDIAGNGDIYSKGFKFLTTAITNPNKVQTAFGLAGSGGWGSGLFEPGTYPNLPADAQLYHMLAIAAWRCQDPDAGQYHNACWCKVATVILPALAPCRKAALGGCDFDPHVPLARGGGHMEYLGNWMVSFNQGGYQRTARMNRLDPPGYDETPGDWLKRIGVTPPGDCFS